MTEPVCTYAGDRDEALITFLYDDGRAEPEAERALFAAHLRTCAVCRGELDTLRGVRAQLARWSPPEPKFAPLAPPNPPSVIPDSRAPWRVPVWAQAAAAVLVLGAAAGIANLDVHYDRAGLTIRTGWSRDARDARGGAAVAPPAAAADAAPWKADLAALERQMRSELRSVQASNAAAAAPRTADADQIRRVRALIDDSEKRQQRELALRVAELMRDVNVQRQADLVRVDRALGLVENKVGVEVLKNRQQMNYVIRTSQRQ